MFFDLATLGLLGLESDSFAERQAAQARLGHNPIVALIAKPAGPESERSLRRALDPWIAVWLEVKAATFVEAVLDEKLDSECSTDFTILLPNQECFGRLDVGFVNVVYTQWAERRGWYGISHGGRGPDWGAGVMRDYWNLHHARTDDGTEDDPL